MKECAIYFFRFFPPDSNFHFYPCCFKLGNPAAGDNRVGIY
ncbi:Uncharacterised protein [Mycobacteroides abscessus subsp. abscessus]|nr:Uncharacterised protein [Mycobacteroides abscessus subsp. abscessus]